MKKSEEPSVFARYFEPEPFADRFLTHGSEAVDVIVPIIHTNELWRKNLISIYREIPVNRLILGDGGSTDGSIDLAREFPRVEVLDHREFTSLGFSLRRLIEAVETDWFVYLHSDVYLPPDWFETMCKHRGEYDWFECSQRITLMADYMLEVAEGARAFSGSQMGKKSAFAAVVPLIDDDYLYRNEDIILAGLVTRAGHRYGRVTDTFHFHQVMHKPSRWRRPVKRVDIHLDVARDEDIRANDTYVRGIVKYLDPDQTTQDVVDSMRYPIGRLANLNAIDAGELRDWVKKTNSKWLPHLGKVGASARRDWIADRVIAASTLYRHHGALWTLGFAARRLAASFRARLTASRDRAKD
ncbi:glycosyltransferase family 2 protein [Tardiphaga sp. 866_E4_N2_1]|uniref:glycosyltransferase family 2 protein n=1 Tax=unclassified Tardiphaga TaxID=2631404 RepID=UPI003F27B2B2